MKSIITLKDKILKKYSIKIYNKVILKRAIAEAKLRWIRTGKKHYVIPVNDEYIVVNNEITKRLQRTNGKKWRAIDLAQAAVYITPVSTFHNI